MSDLGELFRSLAGDTDRTSLLEAADIRRAADRHRVVIRLLSAAVGVALALTAVGVALQVRSGQSGDRVATDGSSTPGSTPTTTDAARPWLPEPWKVVGDSSGSWGKGQQSPPLFCGVAMAASTAVSLTTQVLEHPSGRTATLTRLTVGDSSELFQLFKFSYASCLEKGDADSVAGPRNVWSYDDLTGGSEIVGGSLHLLEMRAAPGAGAPSRDDVGIALDDWAKR